MKDDGIYIHHVLECIRRIERYCEEGERNLQTLAESTQHISIEMKGRIRPRLPVLKPPD